MINNENGRSMVEMLGVLAIIGVLSVAGISGYSMAMRKIKANDIIDLASKVKIVSEAGNGGDGKAYSHAELESLVGKAPSNVKLCTEDAGEDKVNVIYQITDEALRGVVSASAPSWLIQGTCL